VQHGEPFVQVGGVRFAFDELTEGQILALHDVEGRVQDMDAEDFHYY
jgi:hypothetical protein